jgi:uncharacterized protein
MIVKSKLIHGGSEKTWALIFDKGDEVVSGLTRFAEEQRLGGSRFTAIGAFSDVRLGYFDRERSDYNKIPIDEQVEVLVLAGDVALRDGRPQVHAHVVLGKADGTAHGGHLLTAHVWPTLELILVESPQHLQRKLDEETGLALIQLGE